MYSSIGGEPSMCLFFLALHNHRMIPQLHGFLQRKTLVHRVKYNENQLPFVHSLSKALRIKTRKTCSELKVRVYGNVEAGGEVL